MNRLQYYSFAYFQAFITKTSGEKRKVVWLSYDFLLDFVSPFIFQSFYGDAIQTAVFWGGRDFVFTCLLIKKKTHAVQSLWNQIMEFIIV